MRIFFNITNAIRDNEHEDSTQFKVKSLFSVYLQNN